MNIYQVIYFNANRYGMTSFPPKVNNNKNIQSQKSEKHVNALFVENVDSDKKLPCME